MKKQGLIVGAAVVGVGLLAYLVLRKPAAGQHQQIVWPQPSPIRPITPGVPYQIPGFGGWQIPEGIQQYIGQPGVSLPGYGFTRIDLTQPVFAPQGVGFTM